MYKKLSDASPRSWVKIVSTGDDIECMKRLAELGFLPGETMHIVVNNRDSYVIVESNRGRFGLPKEIAESILVEEVSSISSSSNARQIVCRCEEPGREFR